jgi:hypothetical protein
MRAIQANLARAQAAIEAGHLAEERAQVIRRRLRMAAERLLFLPQQAHVQPSPTEIKEALETPRKSNKIYQVPVTDNDSIISS